jgi:hypothetical protein
MPLFYAAQVRGTVSSRWTRRLVGALLPVTVGALACDPNRALKVPEPDTILPGNITSASALPALRNATLSAFQIAYSGAADQSNFGHEGQINMTGLFTDELQDEETFTSRVAVDGRSATPGNGSLNSMFVDISTARSFADRADGKYNQFAPADTSHALVLSIGAYLYTLFAENYCEGVPASTLHDDGTITYGVPLTRHQLLDIAIQRFDSAITIATAAGNANNLSLAQIGLGRALLDSNDDVDAAAAVAAVPIGYVYDIGASTNTSIENNGIWNYTFNNFDFSVSDSEGTNGLPFFTANDPRVPVFNTGGPGFSSGSNLFYQQLLYPLQTSPIPLATGVEAQLIIAEHQLRTLNTAGWLATLNALRATVTGLAPLADPGSQAARISLHFHERAFWMFLTSHRLGDLRRLVRQYGRDQATVFPVGIDIKLQAYGTDVNFPVSADEINNPNFHGCLNRNA